MAHAQRVFRGFDHTDAPREALGIDTTGNDLATNLHHEVLNPTVAQHTCYGIHTKALGDGRAVEHHTGILLLDLSTGEGDLLVAGCPPDASWASAHA